MMVEKVDPGNADYIETDFSRKQSGSSREKLIRNERVSEIRYVEATIVHCVLTQKLV